MNFTNNKLIMIIAAALVIVIGAGAGIYFLTQSNPSELSQEEREQLADYLDRLAEERGIDPDSTENSGDSQPSGMLVRSVTQGDRQLTFEVEQNACDSGLLQVQTQFDLAGHQGFLKELVGKRMIIETGSQVDPNVSQIVISNISQIRVIGTEIADAIEAYNENSENLIPFEYLRMCADCFRDGVFGVEIPAYSISVNQLGELKLGAVTKCGRVAVTVESKRGSEFSRESFADLAQRKIIIHEALIENPANLFVSDPANVEVGGALETESQGLPE